MLNGEPYSPNPLFVAIQKIHLIEGNRNTQPPFPAFSFIHACLIMASFPFSVCIICATKAPAAVRDFLMPPSSQIAIQLTLILISCSLYSMYPSSSSSSSSSSSFSESSSRALLVLVISTCLFLLFTNLRKLLRDNSTHKANKAPPPASMEEAVTLYQEKSIVPQDEVPEDLVGGSLSDPSECTTNDEDGTEEGSLSDEADDDDDDDSLIEISLVDGHFVGGEQAEQRRAYSYKKDLLAEFLPDLLLDRRDFFDILSEISEEDSLIEIDIARGSIKCSANLDIKA